LKLVWSALVLIVWAVVMVGNLAAAGRTAGQMQLREGIPERDAQRRTTKLVLGWAIATTAIAIALLVVIW